MSEGKREDQWACFGGAAKKGKAAAQKVPELVLPAGANPWIGNPFDICKPLSDAELKEAAQKMEDDLLKGKTPMKKDAMPHFIQSIGTPGSGKSTVTNLATAIIHKWNDDWHSDNYVVLDFDALMKYHPRTKDVWSIPDMLGKPTGIGFAQGWTKCEDFLTPLMQKFVDKVIELRYNMIVQSHQFTTMIDAKMHGYACTLVYVAAPLELAQQRARRRALTTGMFLSVTLARQDEFIEERAKWYRTHSPWYALWADHFIAVKNDSDDHLPSPDDFFVLSPHEIDGDTAPGVWVRALQRVYAAIEHVHGGDAKGKK